MKNKKIFKKKFKKILNYTIDVKNGVKIKKKIQKN